MSESIEDLNKVIEELDTELKNFDASEQWQINVSKASDGRYIILFNGSEKICPHAKHIAHIKGYTFVYCKSTKNPIALYCDEEITNSDDATEMLSLLADEYQLLRDLQNSPYFNSLAKVLVNTTEISVIE